MIIYLAGVDRGPSDVRIALKNGVSHFMVSFHYRKRGQASIIRLIRGLGGHLFLDSGAYSAWKKGLEINIIEYMDYIRRNQFGKYMALDVVGDPEKSAHNLHTMEEAGLLPVPVFHMGSDWQWMDSLAERHGYVAIGGTVGADGKTRADFFSELFERYPGTNFHGLGMTTEALVCRFPWHSVDSTTWLSGRKNYCIPTESGTMKLPSTLAAPERVRLGVRYFASLQNRVNGERFGL